MTGAWSSSGPPRSKREKIRGEEWPEAHVSGLFRYVTVTIDGNGGKLRFLRRPRLTVI
jgi:hypothetical protein